MLNQQKQPAADTDFFNNFYTFFNQQIMMTFKVFMLQY